MAESTDLELQFDSITPDNLKENDTINRLLKIYLSSLSESTAVLDNPLNLLDTDYLIKKFEETGDSKFDDIRKELFRIHLQEISQTFDEIGDSEEIYNKFKGIYEALNIPVEDLKIVADIDKSINSEYLDAANSFKTKKGTRSGFFFVYDIINRAGIQAINADEFFNLIEGTKENPDTPYEYTVETSLYKEVFDKTVVPLAHPVGFNWNFIRLLFLTMEDYFGLEQIKTLEDTTLTCYGTSNLAINTQEIVKSGIYGTVKTFNTTIDQNKNEEVIIDYNPKDGSEGNGYRLVRQFDGRVVLYDRQLEKVLVNTDGVETGEIQYLEILDVRVVSDQEKNGILEKTFIDRTTAGETVTVLDSISFKEYTIIDKAYIDIEYKILGDFEDHWTRARLKFVDKVVSDDKKFFEPQIFTREDIFSSSGISYNGRIVEDMGANCLLNYKATYTYKVSTKDIEPYVENIRPTTTVLAKDVRDIEISGTELQEALDEGRDPYEGLYASHDHTVQEFNEYDGHDNWARLDYGNYKLTGNIGDTGINPKFNKGHLAPEIVIGPVTEEVTLIPDGEITDLTIGGDWILSDNDSHDFDKGFNSNAADGPRWEQYYRPLSANDLSLIPNEVFNSLSPDLKEKRIAQYEKENTEWYGDKTIQWDSKQNNNEYTAWESKTDDIFINVFHNEEEFNLDKTPFFEVEPGVDGEPKLKDSEVKVIINEGTDEEEIVTLTDNEGNPVTYLATVYVQREETFHDINFRPTINTPEDGLQYVDGQEEESYENNQKYKISAGLVDADPVNMQLETTEQIFIMQYIPFKDAWTRDGNNLSLFNYRDLAEAEAGDVPVIDFTDMDDTWNTDWEVFGVNGLVNPKTGEVQNEGDYLETKHNTDTWTMFARQEYSYETFEEWYIGDEENIGEIYVDGQGYYELVDADIYRGMWSFREDHEDFRKFETFDFAEKKDLGSDIVAEDNTIADEDGEIKSIADKKDSIDFKHTFDEFYKGELTDLNIGDFDINGENQIYSSYRDDNRDAYIGYEYMYKDSFYFTLAFNIINEEVEYCYDTLENWEIGEEEQYIGCEFVDGKACHEKVKAEIFRAQWNYNEFLADGSDNPEFEKYEESSYILKPLVEEIYGELQEPATLIQEEKEISDDFMRDWNELEIGEDWDIGGEHENYETDSLRPVYIGFENMYKDSFGFAMQFNLVPKPVEYCYDTMVNWNIGDEDEQEIGCTFIDGIPYHEEVQAEIFRAQWNFNEFTSGDGEDFTKRNPEFEKYENFDFSVNPIMNDNISLDEDEIDKSILDAYERLDAVIHTENTVEEFGEREELYGTVETILLTPANTYCYDTMVNWNIDDEGESINDCLFVDGVAHSEDVEAEIYRNQWNYNYYTAANDVNPDFEKYEISNFELAPNISEDMKIDELGNDTDIKESKSVYEETDIGFDDVAKDWHDLRIDDFDIGGEHDNPETSSVREVYIGYEYMFQDAANIGENILGTPTTRYTYNTFVMVYIGDELNIADDEDFIDGKGVNIDIEADLYRGEWNVHDDEMVTEDNVITTKYEIVGLKMYREDDDGNWVYLPDNNIEAAE